jgi:hypothetical protein
MFAELVGMKADLEMLKSAFGNALKVGPVEVVDAQKGYRLRLGGTDEEPYLSPFYPHPETGKTSVPLKKGQIVGVMNPSGDPRQGLVFRAGYSDANPSPNNDMEANVFEDAGVRIRVANGALVIEAGGVTHTISGEGVSTTGGRIEHDGSNIGSTHVHGGVEPGGADTAEPH